MALFKIHTKSATAMYILLQNLSGRSEERQDISRYSAPVRNNYQKTLKIFCHNRHKINTTNLKTNIIFNYIYIYSSYRTVNNLVSANAVYVLNL